MRILVVEDQLSAAEALQQLLEFDGHDVVIAPSYQSASACIAAADAASGTSYDIVLLDLKLPDGDGRDLVALTRAGCPKARIYLATGSAVLHDDHEGLRFEDMAELVKQLGADGCLGKPIDYDELMRVIDS